MSEVIYYSDSISKIVTVFAIECAIVVGFILLLIFCCFSKMCCYGGDYTDNKDIFMFKKYSSTNKISTFQIETLYKQDKHISKDKDKSIIIKLWEYMLKNTNISREKIHDDKIHPDSKLLNPLNDEFVTHDKINSEETKENNKIDETDKYNESKTINDIKNSTTIYNDIDIEHGLNKIYLIYEFNNLDKMINPSSYIESNVVDEFDELEEFVNMVIKSFENKYSQIGILLKISSPGGSAFKFEHAYLNLLRLKDKGIELIGLVDKMAASGGYMLASACDKIICAKYATIGSVGVIAQLYNWSELSKKVGLEEKTWTTGSHKNPFPTGSTYTEEDNKRMEEMIDETFNIFKSIVIESRKFTPEQMEEICKAKTFPGFTAYKLNMVDKLELTSDYIDRLSTTNDIWICTREKKSKSIINTLLMENLKLIGIDFIKSLNSHLLVDKKINGIKLI